MPRRTTNSSMLGAVMDSDQLRGLQSGTRLTYLALLAITRKPYVDNAPFIHSALSRLTALQVAQVSLALEKLHDSWLFVPSKAARFSEAFYLPHAMDMDRSLSPTNKHHLRHVQNRIAKMRKAAPDLCDLFAADYPEWKITPSTALTEVTSDGLESPAGEGTTAD